MTVMQIQVGEPIVRDALTLFPLTMSQPPAPEYLAGPVAEAAHAFVVEEDERGATVEELVVQNIGGAPVLLIEGETLLGAKQNRTLNLSVLCTPHVSTPIPVSCVEAGRWGIPRPSHRSTRHSPPRIRLAKVASTLDSGRQGRGHRSDQSRVWSDVDDYAHTFGVASPTSALEDVYDRAEPAIHALVDDLEPLDGQQGVLVAIGGEIRNLDVFDKPSTLAAYWSGLLAGSALDAAGQPPRAASPDAAAAFVAQVSVAPRARLDAPGLGETSRFDTGQAFGTLLAWDGAVVHLAAFASN
jgi:hypothetical protein